MDKGQFLIETHLRTGRPIAELAKAHGVSRGWLYKLLRRYRLEGPAGLEARSRRPKSSPSRISDLYEDEIVRVRKELDDAGFDSGAQTIHFHMSTPGRNVPSASTIHRVLVARGFVIPEPHKRPRSSWNRFEAEFPNECWQADVTHVEVANGVIYEVLNVIDDHSRLCVASHVFVSTHSPDVVRTMHAAALTWGYPQRFLTDNGAIFTATKQGGGGGVVAMEAELLSLGIGSTHGKPYHPQTQGKVERFHQTMKKYLGKQDPALTKKQLQGQLNRFVSYYNESRPHRAIGRRTPFTAFNAREKAVPKGPRIDTKGYRVLRQKVDHSGGVTLRHKGKLHHIGIGCPYAGWRIVMLVDGLDIRILGLDGSPLRHLTLDPSVDYQRMP
jgi:transposase InsO family protein